MTEALLPIVLRSLLVSGTATLLAVSWSIPVALKLGLSEFRGKRIARSFFNAMIGVPTVALGLILYLILSKQGTLGFLNLLFTPTAIIIGQAILITPIVISLLSSAIESVDPSIKELAMTLGASEPQASHAVLREARKGSILAVIAAFNRAVAELGIALMLGGNIAGRTRVMTTEIARGVSAGETGLAIQLTVVLLAIVLVLTFLMNLLRGD
jgi:tungstate transport system permease protein